MTSNYGAMYPSTGNGTTIVTTKSGTDQIHGVVYEFLRNEAFNSKGYFDIGNKAPMYRRNDFGGTIGGPIVIPHIYNGTGKSHFFFSEEARIETDPYAFRRAVPSLAERNGDFTDVCPYAAPGQQVAVDYSRYPDCPQIGDQTIYSNGADLPASYPGNKLTSFMNPAATAILNSGIIPAPNATSGCNSTIGYCYDDEVALPTYYREELFRIDHTINDKTQAGFRYIHDEWDTTTSVPQWGAVVNSFPTIRNRFYGPGLSMAARVTSAISSSFLNEFVASYTDSHVTLADVAAPAVSLARPDVLNSSLGYLFNNGSKGIDGVPKMPGIVIAGNNAAYGGNGFAVDSSYMPWRHTNPTYSFTDNMTKTIGKHDFQFGIQAIFFQRNQVNGSIGAASGDVQGLMTFSNAGASSSSGNAFADFLTMFESGVSSPGMGTGRIASFEQDSGQAVYHQRYAIGEPYLQDTWKVTPRLTATLGVRLSLFGTYHEKNGNSYNWDPREYSRALEETVQIDPLTGEMLNALTGKPVQYYNSDESVNPQVINGIVRCGSVGPGGCMGGGHPEAAPRIGLAWDPFGNGRTSIRAGYGIFFEHGTPDEANTGSLEGGAPIVLSATQLNPSAPNCIGNIGANCPVGPGAFPLNVTSIPTKIRWPYVQQWSMSIEHELPVKMLMTIAYVGSKGTHLTTEIQANQLLPVPASVDPFAAGEPIRRVNCGGEENGVGYNGAYYQLASGTKIWPTSPGFTNMQAACYGSGSYTNPNALRQNYPGLGQIYQIENAANSSYHAFQATLRRVQGPLNLGVAYTFSHSIDNASDRSDSTFTNSYDLRSNRASSNFDQRQLLHISYVYEIPTPWKSLQEKTGLAALNKYALGGWQISGVTAFETGIPFSVVSAASPNGVGVNDNAGVANGVGIGAYPDVVGDPHGARPAVPASNANFGPLLLNPGAFAAPRGLTFGDAGRNFLNNPSRWNFDTSMLKHFKVKELADIEFRAEAFNVFNHTQFRIYDPTMGNQPNNTVSCYGPTAPFSAGDPGGADDQGCLVGQSFLHPVDAHRPRTLQFGLKVTY